MVRRLGLRHHEVGFGNTLTANTTGLNNTASGSSALGANTTGGDNTASGVIALGANTTGLNNTATGFGALRLNTTGSSNIALGYRAGQNLTTGSNNITIGNDGVAGESGIIRIGTTQTDTYLAGIIHGDGSGLTGIQPKLDRQGTVVAAASGGSTFQDLVSLTTHNLGGPGCYSINFRTSTKVDSDGPMVFNLVVDGVDTATVSQVGGGIDTIELGINAVANNIPAGAVILIRFRAPNGGVLSASAVQLTIDGVPQSWVQ